MAATLEISPEDTLGRIADIGDAEKVLDRLEKTEAITHAGLEWFKVAVDPFHDRAERIDGYPDGSASTSVVQVVKRSMTISAPAGLAPGANWDCNIFNLPILDRTPLMESSLDGSTYGISQLSVGGVLGSITASSAPNGSPTFCRGNIPQPVIWPPFAGFVGNGYALNTINPVALDPATGLSDAAYTDGGSRLIACGFEVINATAPLYVQGTVTCYRQAAPDPTLALWPTQLTNGSAARDVQYTSGAAYGLATNVHYTRGPPARLEDAILLPDARQWHAKRGAYAVCRQRGEENPFTLPVPAVPMFLGEDPAAGRGGKCSAVLATQGFFSGGGVTYGPCVRAPLSGPPSTYDSPATTTQVPFETVGVYFTGLSPQTTLTINARFIMERCPTVTESDLIVLAQKAPQYDETAMRLYTQALANMPPAVPLSENFLGGWFKDIVKDVAGAVMPAAAGAAKKHPLVAAGASMLGAVQDSKRKAKAKAKAKG